MFNFPDLFSSMFSVQSAVPRFDFSSLNTEPDDITDKSDIGYRSDVLLEETETYRDLVEAQESIPALTDTFFDFTSFFSLPTRVEEEKVGADQEDVIFGTGADEIIFGGAGNDMLNGGAGDDVIRGGSGRDILEGGAGNDTLEGGSGIDVFIFRAGDGTTTITDFDAGYDILDVEGFTNLGYDELLSFGSQQGDNVHFQIEDDLLVLEGFILSEMTADDLCIR